MDDIIYSRQNSDGTFQEKWLTPSASHFVICGPCGDLTTFTGSFGGGGGGDTVKVSVVDSTSDYLEPKLQAGPNVYISKSVDGDGYETLHFSSSATGEFDDSHLVTTASFNAWTGSPESQFAGTASFTYTASYGLYFTASNHMVVVTGSDESLGYIDLYGGMLYGTSSWAVSASWPQPSSFDDSHLVTTTSFNDWTGSTESQFAGTASFAISASWAPESYIVKVSDTDETASYLENKLQAGPNIYISKSIDEGYEILHFSSSGGGGSGPTDAYVQGGNSFGATGKLGLLDNYNLEIYANDTRRMSVNRNDISFYTNGSYSFDFDGPVTPTLKLFDAGGDEYCQVRGRWYGPPDYWGCIGIGLNCFVSASDWNVYSSLAFGNNAMRDHQGAENVWNIVIGHDSLIQSDPDSWDETDHNVIVGHESLRYSGGQNRRNVLLGNYIISNDSTASINILRNVVIGTSAGIKVAGNFIHNVLAGENVCSEMLSGSANIILGAYAAQHHRNMMYNIAIGEFALRGLDNNQFSSSNNIAIGGGALSATKGHGNVVIGGDAATQIPTGYNLTVLGYKSCDRVTANISNSIAIGYSSSLLKSGEMVLGGSSNESRLGLVRPGADTYTDIGSATHRFKNIYLSGSVHIDGESFTGSKTAAVGEFLKVIVDGNERWLQLYV